MLNLPIALAVALLKNPRGQIDLKVPVSGSLSDPNFSIIAVILQVFKNLILKAVTSPFNLLASVAGQFSGGEQLDYVEFKPGYAQITQITRENRKKLEKLAKALNSRPALRLNISGRVDPAYDHDGLRAAMLERLVQREKTRQLANQGQNVNPATIQVSSAEYNKYLRRVYKSAKFDKPRDFLGLDKSLPASEMTKLLLAHTNVTENDLQHLADARAQAVRQALSQQVDPARLFIIVPTLNAQGIKDKGNTTRVDLSLN